MTTYASAQDTPQAAELRRCKQRRMEIARLAIAWAKTSDTSLDPIIVNEEALHLWEAVSALFAIEGQVDE